MSCGMSGKDVQGSGAGTHAHGENKIKIDNSHHDGYFIF